MEFSSYPSIYIKNKTIELSKCYHGLPNLLRPLIEADGAFLNGSPRFEVATPPGRLYDPGPGAGSFISTV